MSLIIWPWYYTNHEFPTRLNLLRRLTNEIVHSKFITWVRIINIYTIQVISQFPAFDFRSSSRVSQNSDSDGATWITRMYHVKPTKSMKSACSTTRNKKKLIKIIYNIDIHRNNYFFNNYIYCMLKYTLATNFILLLHSISFGKVSSFYFLEPLWPKRFLVQKQKTVLVWEKKAWGIIL